MRALALSMMMLLSPGIVAANDDDATLDRLTIDGLDVTRYVSEPVSGVAGYVAVGDRLFQADESATWTETGSLPNYETMIQDSDEQLDESGIWALTTGSLGAAAVIQDSAEPDVLWSGTEPDCYRGGGEATPLRRSADAGATWTESGRAGLAPLASWADSGIVLARGCPGLHMSLDDGASFQTLEVLLLGMRVTSSAAETAPGETETGPVILVGLTGEGGTSYLHRVDLTNPTQPIVSDVLLTWFAISPLDVGEGGSIYVGASHGVLVSQDEGASWDVFRDGLESTTLPVDPLVEFPPDLEPGSFGLSALLAHGDQVVVSGVDGLYGWQADDDAWTQIATTDVEVSALALMADGSTVLCQTEDGVFELGHVMEATPVASPVSQSNLRG